MVLKKTDLHLLSKKSDIADSLSRCDARIWISLLKQCICVSAMIAHTHNLFTPPAPASIPVYRPTPQQRAHPQSTVTKGKSWVQNIRPPLAASMCPAQCFLQRTALWAKPSLLSACYRQDLDGWGQPLEHAATRVESSQLGGHDHSSVFTSPTTVSYSNLKPEQLALKILQLQVKASCVCAIFEWSLWGGTNTSWRNFIWTTGNKWKHDISIYSISWVDTYTKCI